VNTKNWKSFIEVQNAESRYPGMKAIGYAEVVHEQDVAGYQAQLRSETGNAAITVHPNAVADNNVILKYHEPTAATSPGQAQAVGFVLSSSAERLKALKQAEKTGKIAAAAPVQLATNSAPGFLLILPLSDKPTLEKGSRSVFGYSVAAFEIAPLIDSTIGPRLTQYGTSLTITDISEDDAVLYSTPVGSGLRSLTRDVVIQVADRQWRLTFQTPSRNLIMAAGRYAPMGILGIGIVAILASCVLIYAIKLRKKMSDAIVS
jgi:CHASE1-domain containing sensor protein